MKKNLVAAGLGLIISLSAFAGTNNVDYKSLDHFKKTFKGAENVSWVKVGDFDEVKFTWSGENMAVFYTQDGQYVASSRKIDFNTLPLAAETSIREKYSDFTVTEVAEVDHQVEGFGYYISLESGKEKIILKSSSDGSVSVFKKEKL